MTKKEVMDIGAKVAEVTERVLDCTFREYTKVWQEIADELIADYPPEIAMTMLGMVMKSLQEVMGA